MPFEWSERYQEELMRNGSWQENESRWRKYRLWCRRKTREGCASSGTPSSEIACALKRQSLIKQRRRSNQAARANSRLPALLALGVWDRRINAPVDQVRTRGPRSQSRAGGVNAISNAWYSDRACSTSNPSGSDSERCLTDLGTTQRRKPSLAASLSRAGI